MEQVVRVRTRLPSVKTPPKKKYKRTRFPLRCEFCGAVFYVQGPTRREKSRFCGPPCFGAWNAREAKAKDPKKDRSDNSKRCPQCRVHRKVHEFVDKSKKEHPICLRCLNKTENGYAVYKELLCVDCHKPSGGTRRCIACQRIFLRGYLKESGEELNFKAHDPLTM